MKEFVGLIAKTYSCLKDDNDEDKKTKGTKKWVIKRKLKFQDYKNCLEAAQVENKKNHSEKNKIADKDADSLQEDQKEFIKNNKLTLKTKHRFRSEKHNIFTEEIHKIALCWNDDKRIQPINSIDTYVHGTSKDLVLKKQEIKCNNIIQQYKNV